MATARRRLRGSSPATGPGCSVWSVMDPSSSDRERTTSAIRCWPTRTRCPSPESPSPTILRVWCLAPSTTWPTSSFAEPRVCPPFDLTVSANSAASSFAVGDIAGTRGGVGGQLNRLLADAGSCCGFPAVLALIDDEGFGSATLGTFGSGGVLCCSSPGRVGSTGCDGVGGVPPDVARPGHGCPLESQTYARPRVSGRGTYSQRR